MLGVFEKQLATRDLKRGCGLNNTMTLPLSLERSGEIAARPIRPSFRKLFGLPLCDLSWDEALEHIQSLIGIDGRQTVLSFLNAHNANLMLSNPEYRAVLSRQLVFPDGLGINIASRVLKGSPFPANLNGTDFVPALLTYISQPLRVGLVGARGDVLDRAVDGFRRHTPWHTIVGISDGYFDKEDCGAVLTRIGQHQFDVIVVAMGTPLQEVWVDQHIRPEHASLVITAGALFDFAAGSVSRAPEAWRRLGLEWLHRLKLEPTRLWRRYILGIPLFFLNLVIYRFLNGNDAL